MLEHAKPLAAALAILAGLPGLFVATIANLHNFGVVLGILSVAVGLGGGMLALYVRKLIRDREEERSEREDRKEQRLDRRFEQLEQRLRELDGKVQSGRDLFQEAIVKHGSLRDLVLALQRDLDREEKERRGDVQRIESRLATGAQTIARIEGRLSALGRGDA